MTPQQVRKVVEREINGRWSESNAHDVDLRRSLVMPRRVVCNHTDGQIRGLGQIRGREALGSDKGTRIFEVVREGDANL